MRAFREGERTLLTLGRTRAFGGVFSYKLKRLGTETNQMGLPRYQTLAKIPVNLTAKAGPLSSFRSSEGALTVCYACLNGTVKFLTRAILPSLWLASTRFVIFANVH